MRIPKKMGHIWIGPKMPPVEWMETWRQKHPDWEYTLYDNEYLAQHEFRTRNQIEEYIKRGWYAGAADLMRYEVLYRHGGFLAEADSICLHPIDELMVDDASLYTVYENEFVRGSLVSPILGAAPGHPFLNELIERLSKVPPLELLEPWKQTGNLFVAELIEELRPDITIWPSHMFIPVHFTGRAYKGDGKIYAKQLFGETTKAYKFKSRLDRLRATKKKRYARKRSRALNKARP